MTERFLQLPLRLQIASMGSEFGRAMKWKDKDEKIFWSEVSRFLEYINGVIGLKYLPKHRKRELLLLREVCLDKFVDAGLYGGSVEGLQKYFDDFAILARKM